MRKIRTTSSGAIAAVLLSTCLSLTGQSAGAAPKAFVGASILPVSGPPIDDGVLIVDAQRIAAVGSRSEVRIPADAEVIDVAGLTIIPGLVDTHSHIGGVSGGDASDPIQPETRVLDSINVRDAGF